MLSSATLHKMIAICFWPVWKLACELVRLSAQVQSQMVTILVKKNKKTKVEYYSFSQLTGNAQQWEWRGITFGN